MEVWKIIFLSKWVICYFSRVYTTIFLLSWCWKIVTKLSVLIPKKHGAQMFTPRRSRVVSDITDLTTRLTTGCNEIMNLVLLDYKYYVCSMHVYTYVFRDSSTQ